MHGFGSVPAGTPGGSTLVHHDRATDLSMDDLLSPPLSLAVCVCGPPKKDPFVRVYHTGTHTSEAYTIELIVVHRALAVISRRV